MDHSLCISQLLVDVWVVARVGFFFFLPLMDKATFLSTCECVLSFLWGKYPEKSLLGH